MLKRNIIAAAIFASQAVVAYASNAEQHQVPGQPFDDNAVADRAAALPTIGKDPNIDRVAYPVADPAPALVGFSRAEISQESRSGDATAWKAMSDSAGRAEAWDELSRIVNTGGTN